MAVDEAGKVMKDIRNYSLLRHNTFGIDACCRRYIEYSSVEELQQVLAMLSPADRPLFMLGSGSNILLTQDFEGTVLHSAIKGCEATVCGDTILLRCGSGEVWDDVVARCVANGWYGAENLSLIPGEVGASAVQNIGAYGVEVKDLIVKVEAIELATGKGVSFDNGECAYAYRQSRFKKEWKDKYAITHVTYRLSTTFTPHLDYGNIRTELENRHITAPTAKQLREVVISIRQSKLPDPQTEGNAGSFFMNPVVGREHFEQLAARYPSMPFYEVDASHVKIPAGWLIEQCGWKGRSLGRAGVHSKQALVLVNRGGATGREVLRLCETIIADVRNKFAIELHPEVYVI